MLGFLAHLDWYHQQMWLSSGVREDADHYAAMEKYGAEALYSVVKSLMDAIWTEHNSGCQDLVHQMIRIRKPWTNRRWS